MTLLELYRGLKTGDISFTHGICYAIMTHVDKGGWRLYSEFKRVMSSNGDNKFGGSCYLNRPGTFTTERETFLLLFAAYKGEL